MFDDYPNNGKGRAFILRQHALRTIELKERRACRKNLMKLQDIFSQIPDPRIDRRKLHLLEDILLLTLLAVLCGAESYESIEVFGKSKKDFLKQVLQLPNGIPSHDTIERVFKRIDSNAFEAAFLSWI